MWNLKRRNNDKQGCFLSATKINNAANNNRREKNAQFYAWIVEDLVKADHKYVKCTRKEKQWDNFRSSGVDEIGLKVKGHKKSIRSFAVPWLAGGQSYSN